MSALNTAQNRRKITSAKSSTCRRYQCSYVRLTLSRVNKSLDPVCRQPNTTVRLRFVCICTFRPEIYCQRMHVRVFSRLRPTEFVSPVCRCGDDDNAGCVVFCQCRALYGIASVRLSLCTREKRARPRSVPTNAAAWLCI